MEKLKKENENLKEESLRLFEQKNKEHQKTQELELNKQIQDQIIGCGAYHQKKVESITAKHLAISANCVTFMMKELLPNFR